VRALAQAYPGIRIDFVVGKGLTDVLSGLPYIDKVIEFDKDGRDAQPQQFLTFLNRVRRAKYDLFINLHPSAKTLLIGKAAGATVRISFTKDRSQQPDTGRVRHAIDDFYKELSAIGICGAPDRSMDFSVPRLAIERVEKLLEEARVGAKEQLVVINPAATRLVNRWPVERFAEVCDFLACELGMKVAITGGPKDRATVDHLKAHAKSATRLIDFCNSLSIKELGALLMRANGFLTCDTGPLHIAAALDTPLVCLSGAADPDRTGPLSSRSAVLIDRQLPCVPCQNKKCRFGTDIRCMTGLSVAEVKRALMSQIGMGGAKQALLTAG
jgi:lipopolysaccharide heptosyltransferase II